MALLRSWLVAWEVCADINAYLIIFSVLLQQDCRQFKKNVIGEIEILLLPLSLLLLLMITMMLATEMLLLMMMTILFF